MGADFYPRRLSEAGQIVGRGRDGGYGPALLWENGAVVDLGVGEAHDINSAGQIVLWVPVPGNGSGAPTIVQNGVRTDISVPPWGGDFRHVFSIGPSGEVVGQATPDSVDNARAFLWANGGLTYLDLPGVASAAHGINDHGQIIGYSGNRGFLLTPVPEPASRFLALWAAVGLRPFFRQGFAVDRVAAAVQSAAYFASSWS